METKQRLEKLTNAKKVLKENFVGLDNIIDDIIKSITPWYVTPEVINRPTVISLWGMTGTGKSSVVKKLIELLDLGEKTISFDCGRESDGSTYGDSLTDKITDLLGNDEESLNKTSNDVVFIFDEFQYARTLDENQCEITKPALRPIWNIIDDGFINIYESRYSINAFQEFLDDSIAFLKEDNKDKLIPMVNGKITENDDIELIKKSTLGIFHFNYKINSSRYLSTPDIEESEEDSNSIDVFNVISSYVLKTIHKKLNSSEAGYGDIVLSELRNTSTFNEFIEILDKIRGIILAPKVLNCTKSLVFIIGNLDEAFKVQENLDHDGDADTFSDITSKVSVTDIKNALKERFRAEQIARLGNNLIKYPTLTKNNFEEIINRELKRIFTEFEKTTQVKINFDKSIINLLYSESVCPTQGVRPIFTTINSLLTPILSEIILYFDEKSFEEKKVDLTTETNNFKLSEININILYNSKDLKKYPIKLQLGELREPQKRKTRYICSVHESGHAIVMASVTGKLPTKIVAVDTSKGGSCYTYDKERHSEIQSKRDIDNDIKISLGGYVAEKIIFGENNDEITLLGSGSDIQNIWNTLSDAVIYNGYFKPIVFSNYRTAKTGNNPEGLDMMNEIAYADLVSGRYVTIYEAISNTVDLFTEEVRKILNSETKLIANMSLELAELGSMTENRFQYYIDTYGSDTLKESIKKSKDDLDYSKYKTILEKFL